MPTETLEPTTAETSTVNPEVAGRLLGLLVANRANYHKGRILKHFEGQILPQLPQDDLASRVGTSAKTYRKSSDLLYREQPADMPHLEDGISGALLTSLADNLAWKGIEGSITQSHLEQIGQVQSRLGEVGLAGHTSKLGTERKALRALVIEDSHFYRDFFDSDIADQLGIDSPDNLRKFLSSSSLGEASPRSAERGISMEIAARRYISKSMSAQPDSESATVKFGTAQEDAKGGDIVVVNGDSVLYLDVKAGLPDGMSQHDIEQGYKISRQEGELPIYKATVWPNNRVAIDENSFSLTDPTMMSRLEQVLSRIR